MMAVDGDYDVQGPSGNGHASRAVPENNQISMAMSGNGQLPRTSSGTGPF